MLGTFDPHPATPGFDRLRRTSTGYAGARTSTSCRPLLGACCVLTSPPSATFCRERVRRGGEMQTSRAAAPPGRRPSLRGVRVEPLRGEVVVWKVSVRSIAAAISEACKVKRRLPHEYPPQKRKSLLTHARRITVGQS